MTYRIGAHILSGYTGDLGHLAVYVLVDCSPEYVLDVRRQVGPEPWIVVRWTEDAAPVLVSPRIEAGDWFARRSAAMRQYAGPRTLTQGPNEVPHAKAAAYAEYEMQRLNMMQTAGYGGAYVAASVGEYDAPTWELFRPVLNGMLANERLVVHEYWMDRADLTNTWHVYRWQHMPALAGVRLLVGEIGRDVTEIGGAAGWRKTCSAEFFMGDLRIYGAGLRRWSLVDGAAVYTMGRIWPQWESFDSNELLPRIVAEDEPREEPVTQTEDASGRLIIELARPLAITPTTNTVSQWFGQGKGNYDAYGLYAHNGLDYRAPVGSAVRAAHPGIAHIGDQGAAGFGRYVKVVYFDGKGRSRYSTRYAHLSEFRVAEAQQVTRGQVIGLSGNTGNSTGAHLHFDLKVRGMVNPGYGDAIDPAPFRTI